MYSHQANNVAHTNLVQRTYSRICLAVLLLLGGCGGGDDVSQNLTLQTDTQEVGATSDVEQTERSERSLRSDAQSIENTSHDAFNSSGNQIAYSQARIAAVQTIADTLNATVVNESEEPRAQILSTAVASATASPSPTDNKSAFTASAFAGKGWYIDSSAGSDKNPGTVSKPWKTLKRALKNTYGTGDALLLKCGGVWRESLDLRAAVTSTSGLLISAYGTCTNGSRPIIRPTVSVGTGGWLPAPGQGTKNNIFRTKLATSVGSVTVDGTPLKTARHRNGTRIGAEFTPLGGSATSTSVALGPAVHGLPAAKLIGATIHTRTRPWIVETNKIVGFDPATTMATLTTAFKYSPLDGSGYIIEGLDWMVDEVDEWAYDEISDFLTVWMPTGKTPSRSVINIGVMPYGIVANGISNLTIERIRIEYPTFSGIKLENSPNFAIRDVQVINAAEAGITVGDTDSTKPSINGLIERSVVVGAGQVGIRSSADFSTIRGNLVQNTGTIARSAGSVAGIYLRSGNGSVTENFIYGSAYSAILFPNLSATNISNNIIDNSCVRMSDCGAIYTYGKTTGTARSKIANNVISSAKANPDGTTVGATLHAAAIYLDEYANQLDVVNNKISDVGIGVNLHKCQDNTISSNQVWLPAHASIRGESGVDAVDPLRNNVVTGNYSFLSRHFENVAGLPLPQKQSSAAQEWTHPVAGASPFHGANPNVIGGNVVVTYGGPSSAQWVIQSGSSRSRIGVDAWAQIADSDSVISPLNVQYARVSGTPLVKNGDLDVALGSWMSYFYPGGVPSSASLGPSTACLSSCLNFLPGTDLDVVFQAGVSVMPWTATSIYYIAYTAIAGSTAAQVKTEVRKDVAPFPLSGYDEDRWDIAAGTAVQQESFFSPIDSENIRISFKGKAGTHVMVDNVQLVQVSSMTLFDPRKYTAHLINNGAVQKNFNCVDAGLASCNVVDDNGAPLSWPITVNPGMSKVVFVVDNVWVTKR